METLEKKPETKVVTLDQVNVRNLPELQGWKQKQQQIVKDHPFVAIEDYKSYEEAKKHRTALVSARTDIQKQDKLIASKLKELRSEAGKVAQELIDITLPHEEKQQEEVKKYESEKEAERLEKERIEQERKEKIQKSINAVYESWKAGIKELQFENIEAFKKDMAEALEKKSEEDLEEFEMDLAEKSRLLNDQLAERVDYLKREEANRAERERLEKERKEFEAQKAKEEEERKAEESRKEKELQEAMNRKVQQMEKILDINGFDSSKDDMWTKGSYYISHNELKQFSSEDLEKRIAGIDESIKKDAELAQLREAQAKAEAERKAKEEDEAKEKAADEEKARKVAEEKRMKALKPDMEKVEAFLNSMGFQEEPPKVKDKALNEYLKECVADLLEIQKTMIRNLHQIK